MGATSKILRKPASLCSISLFYSSFLIWRFMLFYVVISKKHGSNRARRPGQSQCAAKNEMVQDLQGVDMEGSG